MKYRTPTRTKRRSFGRLLPMLCTSRRKKYLLMLFIGMVSLRKFLLVFNLIGPVPLPPAKVFVWNSKLPAVCEKEILTPAESEEQHLRPPDVSKIQYKRATEAEHVVAYIIREMDKMGAPVIIMFGTLLHEYRSSTGNCVEYNMRDKDFDMVVLPEDHPKLLGLIDDIKAKFGWKVLMRYDSRYLLILAPQDQKYYNQGFQIDIYSFQRNHPEEGLLHFPWDKVSFEMDIFFPLVKYKSIASNFGVNQTETARSTATLHYHTPANVPCLLAKMYGDDFMVPKLGKGNQGYGTRTRENIFRKSNWCKKIDVP